MHGYAFDRSWAGEDERLAGLERQLDPVSWAAAEQVGLSAGWRCWEVGAGRGSIAAWLAARVTTSGSVLATDIDVSGLSALDQPNITVIRHDLERDQVPAAEFDLVHARLVLEHLVNPAASVSQLAAALGPGGWLILEDADGLDFEADPAAEALSAIAAPWQLAALAAGWDPMYGGRMLTDLQRAGLEQVAGRIHRSCEPGGAGWASARLGIDRMRGQICQAGASPADLNLALAALTDPTRIITGCKIVTTWGQRTA